MSLVPCPHCSQPLGEDERDCASCGRGVDEPVGSPAPEPARPQKLTAAAETGVPMRTVVVGCVVAAALAAAAYETGRLHAAKAAHGPATAASAVPAAAPASAPVTLEKTAPALSTATTKAPAAADESEHPENEEAELPPVPTDTPRGLATVYGVVYDLATKRPVPDATVSFHGPRSLTTRTDAHGWYRADLLMMPGNPGYQASVWAAGYVTGPFQEHDPPLASLSDVARRTFAEEEGPQPSDLPIALGADVPLAELDMALVPVHWPDGMPAARFADATDPPEPDEPDEKSCRYYGVVYDLATKKPMRRAGLEFLTKAGGSPVRTFTDGKGHYAVDFPVARLDDEPAVTAALNGYRLGLISEHQPALLTLSAKKRKGLADAIDLGFEPVPLPDDDCDDGLVRLDLIAVPKEWPNP